MLNVQERSSLKGRCITNAPEQTVICTTNIVGAMGRGIALTIKQKYPKVFKYYRKCYTDGRMNPNTLISVAVEGDKRILLFPTKIDWKQKSPVELILDNLDKMAELYQELDIHSLAIPPLGMANGWLKDDERILVNRHIQKVGDELPIQCTYYVESMDDFKVN